MKHILKKIKNKRILIIGNSGFVGSWLSITLKLFKANILGFSMKMVQKDYLSNHNFYKKEIKTIFSNINSIQKKFFEIKKFNPEIIIHLASQPIVTESYKKPITTYKNNIMGTIEIMELIRKLANVRKVLVFTSDKVYENNKNIFFTEKSNIGGIDPYSSSKSCQDIICRSYFHSFYKNKKLIIIRSGNILGGNDWGQNRLLPDIIRSYLKKIPLTLRNLEAKRPWLHILDVLNGIILLLFSKYNYNKNQPIIYNLSPDKKSHITVKKILYLTKKFIPLNRIKIKKPVFKEKKYLKKKKKKIRRELKWYPKIKIYDDIKITLRLYLVKNKKNVYFETIKQIKEYFKI